MTTTLAVVRPDDLLVLRFELRNLELDPATGDAPPRLVRVDRDAAAFVVLHLPPQHVAEATFARDGDALGGLPVAPAVVPAVLAGPSRLCFRLPDATPSLPLTLDALLDWEHLTPSLAVDDPADPDSPSTGGAPAPHQTAIELPFRLLLSPGGTDRWVHPAAPPAGARIALWHARLVAAAEPDAAAARPTVRAVHARDFDSVVGPGFGTSLAPRDRKALVRLTSDPHLFDRVPEELLSDDERRRLAQLRGGVARAIAVDHLSLSALGGSLRVRSRFELPPLDGQLLRLVTDALGLDMEADTTDPFGLAEWSHAAMLGRDHYARVVERGTLLPFGHRASRIRVVERVLHDEPPPGRGRAAYLGEHSVLVVHEPERRFASRGLPFVRVRLATLVTPPLQEMSASDDGTSFVPTLHGAPYAFPVVATDWAGREHPLEVPMLFARAGGVPDAHCGRYRAVVPRHVDAGGRPTAFVPSAPAPVETPPGPPDATLAAPGASSEAVFATEALELDAVPSPDAPDGFRPALARASVRLDAVERLVGPGEAVDLEYLASYVDEGFTPANTAKVFARLTRAVPVDFGAGRLGGIAAPALRLTGVSLERGPVPAAESLATGVPDPGQLLAGLGGRLLGTFSLADVVQGALAEPPPHPAPGTDPVPWLATTVNAGGRAFTFRWTPPLRGDRLPAPLVRRGGSGGPDPTLALTGTATIGVAGRAAMETTGRLTDFGLELAGFVRVDFAKLRFVARQGAAPVVDVDVAGVSFGGGLDFLAAVADEVGRLGFGGALGPRIAVGADGVTVSVAAAIPTIEMGAFVLRNLALSMSLALRFTAPPRLRIALSSPRDPFLVAYSLFGGGGHFALVAEFSDIESPDVGVVAGFELGAVAALNFGVARATAQVMIGIYFGRQPGRRGVELSGYVRAHGSVEVLELVTVSLDVMLSLTYHDGRATGRAEVTVMVRVLAFSRSVSFAVEWSFDPRTPFAVPMASLPLDEDGERLSGEPRPRRVEEAIAFDRWVEYCDAFA